MYGRYWTAILTVLLPWMALSQTDETCHKYVLVSVRGTGENQGPSIAFKDMINTTLAALPGGIEHDLVYPASQNPTIEASTLAGATNLTRYVSDALQNCPDQKLVILGYSQGAAVSIISASKYLPGTPAYDAIKGILVVGNPGHKPYQTANIDQIGQKLTDSYFGASYSIGLRFPLAWYQSEKLLDICHTQDIVCAPQSEDSSILQHLKYGNTKEIQDRGAIFLQAQLTPSTYDP